LSTLFIHEHIPETNCDNPRIYNKEATVSEVTTFISYSRRNETFVRRLYNDLMAAGVRPWLDVYNIPPGAIWDDEIQRGLNQCSHVVIVLSAAAVASRNVHAEWNYADSVGKMLIPVIYEKLDPAQIPYRLHGPNWVMFADQDYGQALQKLLGVLPLSAAPNPAAAPEPTIPAPIVSGGKPDPVVAEAAWKRGNAEFHAGNMQAALQAYTESIQAAPDEAEGYIHRGMTLYMVQRYQDALSDFNAAQKHDPDVAELYNNRGVTYLALKQSALALSDFAEALMLSPTYANAYYNLAGAYMALGRARLAVYHYTRAIGINNHVALFYNSRGLAYAAQGLTDLALADYNRAIEIDSEYAGAYGNRANLYANSSKSAEALADYDRVIELDPEHFLAYAGRSELRFCAKDYARAALDAATVIGLQPQFHGGYALRALANFRRGKRDEALADYRQAIQLEPAWKTLEQAAAYLTICPDDELQTVQAILDALK
jgi:tetratricopeptide (TPR) repeat protein